MADSAPLGARSSDEHHVSRLAVVASGGGRRGAPGRLLHPRSDLDAWAPGSRSSTARSPGTADAPPQVMRTAQLRALALIVATAAWVGCAKESTRAPAQPSAALTPPPLERPGLTERQAPPAEADDSSAAAEEPSSPDEASLPPAPQALLGVKPDGTPVTGGEITLSVGKIRLPSGTALTASVAVSEVRALAEEIRNASADQRAEQAAVTVDGIDRTYVTSLSYRDAVRFFDRSLASDGFETSRRTTTTTATVWAVRCRGGERAHVAVRQARPTTIEVVEASTKTTEAAPTARPTLLTPEPQVP